ncbi:MAG: S-layer homology domain-containing protein [bacterium]|nr:S-layer homology domain-containing protein [bacterium]
MSQFSDIGGTPFKREIEWMAARGISQGWTEGGVTTYRPFQPVLRDAMAAFLFRMSGDARFTPPARDFFTDINVPSFRSEMGWMADRGISTGWVENGVRTYRPFQPVLRAEMAAFLYRLAGSPAYTPPARSPFRDVPTSHNFYKQISWLNSMGISRGWDVGGGAWEFRPQEPILRDAMAAFLYRFDQHRSVRVNVRANSAPVISGAGPLSIVEQRPPNLRAGVTATDAEDGNLTSRMTISGIPTNWVPGTYTVRYEVQDNRGGFTSHDRRIVVNANQPPEITVSNPGHIYVGDSFDPRSVMRAIDVEDGDITRHVSVSGTVNTAVPGYYSVFYSVADSHGAYVTYRYGFSVLHRPETVRQDIPTATNQERAKEGLAALVRDPVLDRWAQSWAERMAATGDFRHQTENFSAIMAEYGGGVGENIAGAGGSTDGAAFVGLWMNSDGHRANILGNYQHIGVGVAYSAGGYAYAVQIFGSKR